MSRSEYPGTGQDDTQPLLFVVINMTMLLQTPPLHPFLRATCFVNFSPIKPYPYVLIQIFSGFGDHLAN